MYIEKEIVKCPTETNSLYLSNHQKEKILQSLELSAIKDTDESVIMVRDNQLIDGQLIYHLMALTPVWYLIFLCVPVERSWLRTGCCSSGHVASAAGESRPPAAFRQHRQTGRTDAQLISTAHACHQNEPWPTWPTARTCRTSTPHLWQSRAAEWAGRPRVMSGGLCLALCGTDALWWTDLVQRWFHCFFLKIQLLFCSMPFIFSAPFFNSLPVCSYFAFAMQYTFTEYI